VETFLAIASRRDERRYRPEPLPQSLIEQLLDAGRLSGSSRNGQPWSFVVVEGRESVERLARAVYVPGNVRSASLVVAIAVRGTGMVQFDAGRAAQSMLLAAWAAGVAACPNGIADRELAGEVLGCTADEVPVIVLSFGLPERLRDPEVRSAEEWSARANRKPLDEIVRWLP
jgi:nitroreductase